MPILLSANSTAINLLQIGGKQFAFPAVRASPDERTADGMAEWRTVRLALGECQRTAILKNENASSEQSIAISAFPPWLFSPYPSKSPSRRVSVSAETCRTNTHQTRPCDRAEPPPSEMTCNRDPDIRRRAKP
jgi:hypothetical protein